MDSHQEHESSSLVSSFESMSLCPRRPILGSLNSSNGHVWNGDPASVSCAPSLHPPLRKLQDFVELLQSTGLDGPMAFIGHRTPLGRGAQFAVFKQVIAHGVSYESVSQAAVKQPLFFLEPNQQLNLFDPKVRQQVHDTYLEVLALCHPTLRTHPNIVRILAWGMDDSIWHHPLVLALELAIGDLKTFVDTAEDNLLERGLEVGLWQVKHWLCLDVAAGLDALHDCQLVHGDLKPENVLIFGRGEGVIAKLADFGLSLEETVSGSSYFAGGTPGWRAPEVEEGRVEALELPQADNYSYGLLVWSTMLLRGTVPPRSIRNDRTSLVIEALNKKADQILPSLGKILPKALLHLLEPKAIMRPLRVAESLRTDDESYYGWLSSYASNSEEDRAYLMADHEPYSKYKWELRPISESFADGLWSTFQHDPGNLSPQTTLSLALRYSLVDATNHKTLRLLREAALSGYAPAQTLVASVYCCAEEVLPPGSPNIIEWLFHAVSTGALICAQQLEHLDTNVFKKARSHFHQNGGYNQFYNLICKKEPCMDNAPMPADSGYDTLHWLAAYSTYEAVASYIKLQGNRGINTMTAMKETALYFACMRGDLDIARVLLREGADSSISCGPHNLTCLHWLFAFDEGDHEEAARELIAHGSSFNALAPNEVPFYHFPFFLPSGSPLHWAIALHSESAAKALIDVGADVLLRNNSDPYNWDNRIQNEYSPTNRHTLGLSPLDVASSTRFAYPFQYLLHKSAIKFDINDSDEEDFTVYHRLSDVWSIRSPLKVRYNTRAFRGSAKQQAEALSKTIHAISALGGDINRFTRQSTAVHAHYDSGHSGLTPLMLSAMTGDLRLVAELIKAGADVQRKNGQGMTAMLWALSEPFGGGSLTKRMDILEIVKLLLAHGADIDARTPLGRESVLTLAASSLYLDVVEFTLELGADIGDWSTSPEAPYIHTSACSFWAILREGKNDPDVFDRQLCELLQKYLFAEQDPIRRKHIMEDADRHGSSLLHCYTGQRLPQSVRALLHAGCAVNKVSTGMGNGAGRFKGRFEQGRVWEATPLDVALAAKAQIEKDESPFRQDKPRALDRIDQIITALEEAGGKSISDLQEPAAGPD